MKTSNYDIETVLDLMATGAIANEGIAKKALQQAHFNQCSAIVERINKKAMSEGVPASALLEMSSFDEAFEIDFEEIAKRMGS